MQRTIKFRVSGRVQGVFFRASTKQQADQLRLTGWVRNCENGDVEGVASGSKKQLDDFSRWLGTGPAMARVDNMQLIECEHQAFGGFFVR